MAFVTNLNVFLAERKDLTRMREIENAGWLDAYVNDSLQISTKVIHDYLSDQGQRNFMATSLALSHPSHRFLVAKTADDIAGYGIFKKEPDGGKAHVLHLYVDPRNRNQGVGKAIMTAFLLWSSRVSEWKVNVVSYNTNAIEFYKKFNFQPTGHPPTSRLAALPNGVIIPEVEMTRLRQTM